MSNVVAPFASQIAGKSKKQDAPRSPAQEPESVEAEEQKAAQRQNLLAQRGQVSGGTQGRKTLLGQ